MAPGVSEGDYRPLTHCRTMESGWLPRLAERGWRYSVGGSLEAGSCGGGVRRRQTITTAPATTRSATSPPISPYPSPGGSPSTVAPPPPGGLREPFGVGATQTTGSMRECPAIVTFPAPWDPYPETDSTEYG